MTLPLVGLYTPAMVLSRVDSVSYTHLAGVLALAMLTACDGTTDPDKVIPDIDTANVVDTGNHMAADSKDCLLYTSRFV